MKTDREWALKYAPVILFDTAETIFPRAVGFTVFRQTGRSTSFPKREVTVPDGAACVIEFAYYFDYDIQHMYDLEHIWVTVDREGAVSAAQASFHGKYLNLWAPGMSFAFPPRGERVLAFCQPGKHAFLPAGELFRLVPGWEESCREAGGPVLIGNPFSAEYSSTGQDLFVPTARDDEHSRRWLKERLSFQPTLRFEERELAAELYLPWENLFDLIPGWIAEECRRLDREFPAAGPFNQNAEE